MTDREIAEKIVQDWCEEFPLDDEGLDWENKNLIDRITEALESRALNWPTIDVPKMLDEIFLGERNAYNGDPNGDYKVQKSWIERGWLTEGQARSDISLDRTIAIVTYNWLRSKMESK